MLFLETTDAAEECLSLLCTSLYHEGYLIWEYVTLYLKLSHHAGACHRCCLWWPVDHPSCLCHTFHRWARCCPLPAWVPSQINAALPVLKIYPWLLKYPTGQKHPWRWTAWGVASPEPVRRRHWLTQVLLPVTGPGLWEACFWDNPRYKIPVFQPVPNLYPNKEKPSSRCGSKDISKIIHTFITGELGFSMGCRGEACGPGAIVATLWMKPQHCTQGCMKCCNNTKQHYKVFLRI